MAVDDRALWVVGGLDPTGGAGVLRDVGTARVRAPHRPVHVVVSALTQQGDGKPAVARPTDPDALRFQLTRAPEPAAIKLGLLPASVVPVVAEAVAARGVPVVLDPVLEATAGGSMGASASALLDLLPGTVLTPNRSEYARLVGDDEPAAWTMRHGLLGLLRKGGHDDDANTVTDTLWTPEGRQVLARPRTRGPDPRGTGCALATALACALAEGASVSDAVAAAVAWLDEARQHAVRVGAQWHLP